MDPLQRVSDWLKARQNRPIVIEKKEQGDADRIRIRLSGTEVRRQGASADGYTGGKAIVLQGDGTIASDNGEFPLPGHEFVIPVDGLVNVEAGEDGLHFQTERGEYALYPQ